MGETDDKIINQLGNQETRNSTRPPPNDNTMKDFNTRVSMSLIVFHMHQSCFMKIRLGTHGPNLALRSDKTISSVPTPGARNPNYITAIHSLILFSDHSLTRPSERPPGKRLVSFLIRVCE